MTCLQLTIICIVLQSNIAPLFGAPISDCKSHSHQVGDKTIKVTSHVNVGLPEDSPDAKNAVRNNEIQIGNDSSMHIKIDIEMSPEMLANGVAVGKSSFSANPELPPNYPIRSDSELMKPLDIIEQDQLADPSTGVKPEKANTGDLDAKKDLLGGVQEKEQSSAKDLKLGENPGELNGGLKAESRSLGDDPRPTNGVENLRDEADDDQADDEDDDEGEYDDESVEEIEAIELNEETKVEDAAATDASKNEKANELKEEKDEKEAEEEVVEEVDDDGEGDDVEEVDDVEDIEDDEDEEAK